MTEASKIRVLLLTRYSRLGASSRLRHLQYVPYLEASGFHVDVHALFDDAYLERWYASGTRSFWGLFRAYFFRSVRLLAARRYDVIWLEKEVWPYMPLWLERAVLGRVPVVVDYDDATFHTYDLASSRLVRRALGRKIDGLMARAAVVVAGNAYLADRARSAGARRVEIIPTSVDLSRYESTDSPPREQMVVGWIGTPASAGYLELVRDTLERCAVQLVTIGAPAPGWPGVSARGVSWTEETEATVLQGIDVGIMPIADDPWSRGKCGYKLVQYMASGRPVVASPVGVNRKIVTHGVNGFLASTVDEWVSALESLQTDTARRRAMGAAGRTRIEERYSIEVNAPTVAAILSKAAGVS